MVDDARGSLVVGAQDRFLEGGETRGELLARGRGVVDDALGDLVALAHECVLEGGEALREGGADRLAFRRQAVRGFAAVQQDGVRERGEACAQRRCGLLALLRHARRNLVAVAQNRLFVSGDPLGEQRGRTLAMFGYARGDVVAVACDRAFESGEPLRDDRGDAVAAFIDVFRHLFAAAEERLLESCEALRERGADAFAVVGDAKGGVGAVAHDRVLEGGEALRQGRLELPAAFGDAIGDRFPARQHHALEVFEPVGERLVDAVAMRADGRDGFARDGNETLLHRVDLFRERGGALRQIARHGVVQRLAAQFEFVMGLAVGVLEQADDFRLGVIESAAGGLDMFADPRREPLGRLRQRLVERAALIGDGFVNDAAGFGETHDETVALVADRLRETRAEFLETLDDAGAARAEVYCDRLAARLQLSSDVLGAFSEAPRHVVARAGDLLRDVVARLGERADDPLAMRGQRRLEAVAGFFERELDFLAFRSERGGDARARVAHRFGEMGGGRGELLRKRVAGAEKRGAGVVGVHDDRFALARQLVDQQSDAAFVFRIGAFEVRHLRAHDDFKLAGARQRPFDPVAHRGGLAADRLRERHDLFGGDGFGFDEADRHLGHGVGDKAHLMRAAGHQSGYEEKDDRRDERRESQNGLGRDQRPVRFENLVLVEIDIEKPAGGPQRHRGEGHPHDRAVGLDLQRLSQFADGAAVVIGRRKGRRDHRLRPPRLRDGALRWRDRAGGGGFGWLRLRCLGGGAFPAGALGRGRGSKIKRLFDRGQGGGSRILHLARFRHCTSLRAVSQARRSPHCARRGRALKRLTKYYSPSPVIETCGSRVIRNFVNAAFRNAREALGSPARGVARNAPPSFVRSL